MMQTQQATSTDPTTGSVIFQQKFDTKQEVEQKLKNSWTTYLTYRKSDPQSRTDKLNRLADILEKSMDKMSRMITMEMGKPLKQSRKEVTKSVELIRYYAMNMSQFVKNEDLKTSAKKSYIVFQPMGPIYQMTSYNFPLFNIMRRALPVLVMGNTVLNRSSETTPQTAMMVEEMFKEAGMASGEYINLMTSCEQSEMIIGCPNVRGVSFMGSMDAGSMMASLAGKYAKKIMMDLGGSDPFIVMKDADMNMAVEEAVLSRLKNAGQATICAKRFMIEDSVYEDFKTRLLQRVQTVKIGNPMDESTELGPLANKEGMQRAMEEIKKAQEQGAKLLYGGVQPKDPNLMK
jgi:succinate-semialdehyde dehydrogenase/glutarate-semialdehyde dehydrogenase